MVNNRLRYAKGSPAAAAWGILRDLKVQDFPIDPRQIATKLGIVIWERELPDTCDGCLMRVENAWGILINTRIRSESRRNFTIAHEIGHYMLERDTVDSCSMDERLNFMIAEQGEDTEQEKSNKQAYLQSEQRANQFAAELLMPTPIFSADSSSHSEVGLPAIAALASQYGTSLTSTGIHYTRLSKFVCAIVFSEEGVIRYFAYSDGFRENRNCYLVSGQPLHPKVLASQFNSGTSVGELTGEVPLNYWCKPKESRRNSGKSRDENYKIFEHSRLIPRTKQVITFLHLLC